MIGLPEEALAAKYAIKTHYVVRVVQFYPETQTVDVIQDTFEFTNTPLGDITIKNELGQEVNVGLLEPSILYGIPVKQLRWGQFSIQACPRAGDTGYIEVFTNDISSWQREGGIAVPLSDRRFAKESCVFVPFMANDVNADPNYVSDENTLVIKSTNASITLTDNGETSNVRIISDTTTIDGDVTVNGTLTATTDVIGDGISLKSHMHSAGELVAPNGAVSGQTGEPIGE